jgi:hypothetical protein
VSTDTHFVHKAWHDTSDTIRKIKYTMLGDPTWEISNNFEVLRPGQGLADRGTFIVDPDGVIQAVEITAEGIGRNAVDLLRKVKAAQYVRNHPGEVCPAKWEEGDKTLAPSLQRMMAKPVLCDTCQGLRCRCCGVLQDWSDSWSPVALRGFSRHSRHLRCMPPVIVERLSKEVHHAPSNLFPIDFIQEARNAELEIANQ